MISLEILAAQLRLELRNGNPALRIDRVSGIASAQRESLVFATDTASAAAAVESRAGAILISEGLVLDGFRKPLLLSPNPRLDFARAARLLRMEKHAAGIHPSAMVDPSAKVSPGASIGACAVVAAGVSLGARSIVDAGAVIGEGVTIGEDCHLYPRVVAYSGTVIGDRVIVHAGAVLGSDGYGYVRDPASGEYLQFPQQGRLLIEDDVEIGANTCVDRGALDATIIRRGVKLDNLIHIGHNCVLGRNVLIAAQTGLSGSTTIGDNAIIGGQVGVGDHAHIGENVILGSQAGVLPGKKLRASGGILWGTPAQPLEHILKEIGLLRRMRRKSGDK